MTIRMKKTPKKDEPSYCGACLSKLKNDKVRLCPRCGVTFEEGFQYMDPSGIKEHRVDVIMVLRKNIAQLLSNNVELMAELEMLAWESQLPDYTTRNEVEMYCSGEISK